MSAQKWIVWRLGNDNRIDYVSEVPGDGGVDWGYTWDRKKALPLSMFQLRCFESDMDGIHARGVGKVAYHWSNDYGTKEVTP